MSLGSIWPSMVCKFLTFRVWKSDIHEILGVLALKLCDWSFQGRMPVCFCVWTPFPWTNSQHDYDFPVVWLQIFSFLFWSLLVKRGVEDTQHDPNKKVRFEEEQVIKDKVRMSKGPDILHSYYTGSLHPVHSSIGAGKGCPLITTFDSWYKHYLHRFNYIVQYCSIINA